MLKLINELYSWQYESMTVLQGEALNMWNVNTANMIPVFQQCKKKPVLAGEEE